MINSSKRAAQREGQSGASSQTESRMSLSRFDGNRDPVPALAGSNQVISGISNNVKNVDLGATMWADARGARHVFHGRQPASKLGRETTIKLNAFAVTQLPVKPIYQYTVQVGTGAEKRGLIKKCWNSNKVQSATGPGWIFDGNILAWSQKKVDEIRVNVNLDEEEGKPPRAGRNDVHRVTIKPTAMVRFDIVNSYLRGECSYDKQILESITVLDHIMRENPTRNHVSIKRSFFAQNSVRNPLGGHVDHTTGVYQSLRIAHHPAGHRLVVNADVANGTFWNPSELAAAVLAVTRMREADIPNLLRNNNPRFNDLKRLRRLRVIASHRKNAEDEYVIDHFMNRDSSYELDLGNGKRQTVKDFFQTTYNVRLRHPDWPVVRMTRKAVLPIELLKLKPNQRYTFKLDEMQTSSMIKLAVTPPARRWASIQQGINLIDWSTDRYLQNYGMTISPTPIEVKARVLQNPKLQFAGAGAAAQIDPRTTGRWDLRGKKFASTPPAGVLKCWGVCIMPGRNGPDKNAAPGVQQFVQAFLTAYAGHGAVLSDSFRRPAIHVASNPDPAVAAQEIWAKAGNAYKTRPQILMFVLQNKDSATHGKIKRFCECKLGVVSQCVQWAHVQKCQGQYISNVLMKFNAKLGGYTNTAFGAKTQKGFFDNSTVVIGADVSHAAPGLQSASMAAMTVSVNANATRYAAAVDTNGYRVEMITDDNITKHLIPLVKQGWAPKVSNGQPPSTVIYFRDGVSEGQFAQVIDKEVAAMKGGFPNAKFIVIIASKRHHVRFFPTKEGDKNGNPLPGTLVETGVTQPFENDFYLCSHVAIKGTARPVHYNVLLNEANWPNERIQTFIYEHSYQYIRATTPVSLFPAVYYAHIASNRAAHHSKTFGQPPNSPEKTLESGDPVFAPLMSMNDPAVMNPSMWYI